jgi:hypothetical protein
MFPLRPKPDRGGEDGCWWGQDGHLLLLHQVHWMDPSHCDSTSLLQLHRVLGGKLHLALTMVKYFQMSAKGG